MRHKDKALQSSRDSGKETLPNNSQDIHKTSSMADCMGGLHSCITFQICWEPTLITQSYCDSRISYVNHSYSFINMIHLQNFLEASALCFLCLLPNGISVTKCFVGSLTQKVFPPLSLHAHILVWSILWWQQHSVLNKYIAVWKQHVYISVSKTAILLLYSHSAEKCSKAQHVPCTQLKQIAPSDLIEGS